MLFFKLVKITTFFFFFFSISLAIDDLKLFETREGFLVSSSIEEEKRVLFSFIYFSEV